jgi:hypothetical protein
MASTSDGQLSKHGSVNPSRSDLGSTDLLNLKSRRREFPMPASYRPGRSTYFILTGARYRCGVPPVEIQGSAEIPDSRLRAQQPAHKFVILDSHAIRFFGIAADLIESGSGHHQRWSMHRHERVRGSSDRVRVLKLRGIGDAIAALVYGPEEAADCTETSAVVGK